MTIIVVDYSAKELVNFSFQICPVLRGFLFLLFVLPVIVYVDMKLSTWSGGKDEEDKDLQKRRETELIQDGRNRQG